MKNIFVRMLCIFVVALVLAGNAVAKDKEVCLGTDVYWSVAFSPDSKLLAAAAEGKGGCFELWDIKSLQRTVITTSYGSVHSLAFSHDGKSLYLGYGGGSIAVLNTSDKAVIRKSGVFSPLVNIALSRDGKYMATGGMSAIAILTDLKTESVILKMDRHTTVHSIDISQDGKYLAIGETNGVDLWDLERGMLIKEFEDTDTAFSVRFMPNGRQLIAAVGCSGSGCDKNIKKLDLFDYSITSLSGGPSKQVAVSPDGRFIFSGNTDGKVMAISTKNLSVSHIIGDAGGSVASMDISDDGRYLAVGTWGGSVKVWDINNNQLVISHN